MSEDDKLAYLHYVAGCLRTDEIPLHLWAWKRLWAEFNFKEGRGK